MKTKSKTQISENLVKATSKKINIPNRFAEAKLERKYQQVLVEIQALHNDLKRIPTVANVSCGYQKSNANRSKF